MKARVPVSCSVLLIVISGALACGPASAGDNSYVRLAMHCVAADRYIGCPEDCPQSCEEIDCDLTLEELATSADQGIIYLVAYNVTGLSGIEFALQFPSGAASLFDGPYWCSSAPAVLEQGNPRGNGGIAAWGNLHCLEPETPDGGVIFGYLRVDFAATQPLVLTYAPSRYSYSFAPQNYTLDCTDLFAEDAVVHHHGAVIGGSASLIGSPCEGGPMNELQTWTEVKSMYRN